MSLTRLQYRTRVLQRMDAAGATRWGSTTTQGVSSEIDNAASVCFDREWRRMLSIKPELRMESWTPTSDSSGRYLLTDIQTLTGDSQKRLFRVMVFRVDNCTYQEVPARLWEGATTDNPMARVYWRRGDYLVALPITASKTVDIIWTCHLPTRPDALSDDTQTCVFPGDYDEVVILEAAKMLLLKGGAETNAASDLAARAEELRQDMLQDVCRTGSRPMEFQYGDSSQDWG